MAPPGLCQGVREGSRNKEIWETSSPREKCRHALGARGTVSWMTGSIRPKLERLSPGQREHKHGGDSCGPEPGHCSKNSAAREAIVLSPALPFPPQSQAQAQNCSSEKVSKLRKVGPLTGLLGREEGRRPVASGRWVIPMSELISIKSPFTLV